MAFFPCNNNYSYKNPNVWYDRGSYGNVSQGQQITINIDKSICTTVTGYYINYMYFNGYTAWYYATRIDNDSSAIPANHIFNICKTESADGFIIPIEINQENNTITIQIVNHSWYGNGSIYNWIIIGYKR